MARVFQEEDGTPMLKLYYSPGACSLASHIALREAGAEFELVRLDFAAAEQRGDEFRRINPKGRVPALATERGVVTESAAILAYVAQAFPDARLAPVDDPFAFAEMQAFNLFLSSTVHVTFALGRRGERYADDEAARESLKAKVPQSLGEHFALIEEKLSDGRPFIHGDRYTVSDPYLFLFSRWLDGRGFGSEERTPNVYAHLKRIGERAATEQAIAAEEG